MREADLQQGAQLSSSEVHQKVSEVSKDVRTGAHFTLNIKKNPAELHFHVSTNMFSILFLISYLRVANG